MDYKYLKYKNKYLNLKKHSGGDQVIENYEQDPQFQVYTSNEIISVFTKIINQETLTEDEQQILETFINSQIETQVNNSSSYNILTKLISNTEENTETPGYYLNTLSQIEMEILMNYLKTI